MTARYRRSCTACRWSWEVPAGIARGDRRARALQALTGAFRTGSAFSRRDLPGASRYGRAEPGMADVAAEARETGDARAAYATCPSCGSSSYRQRRL